MFKKKTKRKVDLKSIAFADGTREISYGTFSQDIAATTDYLRKELPSDVPIVGISVYTGPYLHWVIHAACTVIGVPTLAMRANQQVYTDILVVGSKDPGHSGALLEFNHAVLNDIRATAAKDKGKGFEQFIHSMQANDSRLNRILLTSGSTGLPKSVPLTNAVNLARHRIDMKYRPMTASDRVLITMGRDTTGGFNQTLDCFFVGATVLMLQKGGSDPKQFGAVFRQATRVITIPDVLVSILNRVSEPVIGWEKRTVMIAGSRPDASLFSRCTGSICSELVSFYGSTEVGVVSEASAAQLESQPGNVGVLYEGVSVQFSPLTDAPNNEQEPALIHFKSDWMAPGYWVDGEIEPFENGWFVPGDLGYMLDNNELIIAGRRDDVLNLQGEKFSAVNIETQLKALDGIEDAFVTVVNLASRGRLVVMLKSLLNRATLKKLASSVITGTNFYLLVADEIPRNHMGKLERVRLTAFCQKTLEQAPKAGSLPPGNASSP